MTSVRYAFTVNEKHSMGVRTRKSAIADKPRDAFRRQSMSSNMAPFDILGYCFLVVCCSNFVPKKRRFSDNRLHKCWDLDSRVRDHWRSLKVIDRLYMVSYYCHIATLSEGRTVLEIRLQKCRDLEDRVSGPWRSLKMSPFDREAMTFCWCSIVTMGLSRVVSEIFNVEKYCDLEIPVKDQSRSLNVVPFDGLGMVSY